MANGTEARPPCGGRRRPRMTTPGVTSPGPMKPAQRNLPRHGPTLGDRVRVVSVTDPQVRLLIVDDSPRVRRGVSDLFASLEDVEVVGVAANGMDALAQVRRHSPNVVLMDLSMPVMDGIEATRRIKALDPSVSVVILTALHEPEQRALEAGASGRVLKESPPEELVRQVRFAAY